MRFFLGLMGLSAVLYLSGCATTTTPTVETPLSAGIPGVYHHVNKGETLWRISKTYGVDLDELVLVNQISDAGQIEIGQKIFIPRRKKMKAATYSAENQDFTWPVRGLVISSFNQVNDNMVNKGINIKPSSDLEINASRSGKVVFSKQGFKRYGKTVIIDHYDGFMTVYAGASQILVKPGDYVSQGQAIAKYQSSASPVKYVHFEIRRGHIPKNPLFYLP